MRDATHTVRASDDTKIGFLRRGIGGGYVFCSTEEGGHPANGMKYRTLSLARAGLWGCRFAKIHHSEDIDAK